MDVRIDWLIKALTELADGRETIKLEGTITVKDDDGKDFVMLDGCSSEDTEPVPEDIATTCTEKREHLLACLLANLETPEELGVEEMEHSREDLIQFLQQELDACPKS